MPPHKRRRKWPSVSEFWESMEPKEFRIHCTEHADYRKFKAWIRKVTKESLEKTPFDEEIKNRFGEEVDVCVAEYDKPGKINTNMAIFNWDFTYFMTPDEIKKMKDKPEPLKPIKAFDL